MSANKVYKKRIPLPVGAAIILLPRESFNLPGDSVEGLVVVVVVVARRIESSLRSAGVA